VAVDGAPVGSWQDLRWRLLRASGASEVAVDIERPDGSRQRRAMPLASLASADWEGNFMVALGLRADFGAPLIDEVLPDKPAARAGLRAGERIVAIDGAVIRSPAEVAARTNAKPGAEITFRVDRDGVERDVTVLTEITEQAGRKIGIAGMRLKVDPVLADRLAVTVRYGIAEALAQGVRKTWELSAFTVKMLGRILIGEASLKNISGPITMADFAGQSAQAGMLVFVGYLALISISLGVLNLLPVPLLDGGHLLYYFAEIIKGSPVSDRAFEVGQRIGMAMLAVLMALALFNDLSRLF
jgi:regulator of sigma E protease